MPCFNEMRQRRWRRAKFAQGIDDISARLRIEVGINKRFMKSVESQFRIVTISEEGSGGGTLNRAGGMRPTKWRKVRDRLLHEEGLQPGIPIKFSPANA